MASFVKRKASSASSTVLAGKGGVRTEEPGLSLVVLFLFFFRDKVSGCLGGPRFNFMSERRSFNGLVLGRVSWTRLEPFVLVCASAVQYILLHSIHIPRCWTYVSTSSLVHEFIVFRWLRRGCEACLGITFVAV
jgi:hypothetical protein